MTDVPIAILPPPTVGPMERAAMAAGGYCEISIDGTIKASPEWFYNYSRLLLKQAAESRLSGLALVVGNVGGEERAYGVAAGG